MTSLSAGGNFGQTASVTFNSKPAATAPDGDLTGDNIADLVTVGAVNGLPAGVWLANGKGMSGLNPNAVNIGANGNGVTGNDESADFTGATILTGHFHGDGLQDLLAYYPSGPNAGSGVILYGEGDGSVLHTGSGSAQSFTAGLLADASGANPLQLANAGNTTHQGLMYPDLIGISGNTTQGFSLTYYPTSDGLAGWGRVDQLASVLTPTGGTDWDKWTISTAQTASGTAMFLRNASTGALHLWTNLAYDMDSQTLTYTPYALATNWNTNVALQLQAGDINGDGTPDLWTVAAASTVTPWLVSNLSGGSGTITQQPAQALITATYAWPLNDHDAGPVVATDNTGTKTLTATGSAVWRTGDLFSPSVMLNTDPTGTLSDRSSGAHLTHDAALIDTTRSFSISAWVKPTDAGGVIVSEDGAHSSRFILWNEQADNTWRFGMATGDTTAWAYDQVITPTGAQLGVWTHLTATYNAATNTMALYVDGKLRGSARHNAAVTWPATGKFVVGRFLSNNQPAAYYSGQLSNLQVWDRTLTPGQVGADDTQRSGRLSPLGAATFVPPGETQARTDIYGADTAGNLWRYRKNGSGLASGQLLATAWGQYTGFGVADWNHDGYQDLLVREGASCKLKAFLGGPDDLSPEPVEIGVGWCGYTPYGLGDWNKDGHLDIFVRSTVDSALYVYPGDLTGGAAGRLQVGNSWAPDVTPYGVADVTSDGTLDIVARLGNGTLQMYAGIYGSGVQIGTGWQAFTSYGLTDFNGDNRPDIIAANSTTGILWCYPMNPDGTIGTSSQIATGW
ncbi:LamG-like jellyroll fold domain-containing protein [Micromonospora zhanjiangensis]